MPPRSPPLSPPHLPRPVLVCAVRVAGLVVACVLSACALTPRLPASDSLREYAGRFSVSWRDGTQTAGLQRSAGRFLLRVDGPRSELEVSSPLGQTLAMVHVEPGLATLVAADGTRHSAERAETLTEQALGWQAPLSQLPRWLSGSGRARPPATARGGEADSGEAPVSFEDSGWLVSVEAWKTGLPSRLTLRWPAAGQTADGRQVDLRLLIDESPAAPR